MKEAGPLTIDRLKELADAPMGAATKALREHDPLWGRALGEKIKWRIEYEQCVTMGGYKIIEAESEDEAMKIFDKMEDSELDPDEFLSANAIEFIDIKAVP